MEADDLTPEALRELRAPRPYPAVSLTLPTHRREPDNAQDPVRLRNVLAEAERRIDGDPDIARQARIDLKARLAKAAAEVDLRHTEEGLVLFATTAEHRVWTLPREVPERVVLSDTFLTRNLVAAKAQFQPYWVLAVAADRATLWSGVGESLTEHRADGFPAEPEALEWDVQHEERVGDRPSTFQDEETRRFLRTVDTALGDLVATDARPLFLVGLPQAVGLLEEVGSATKGAVGRVLSGGLVNGPDRVLREELRPARAAYAGQEAERVAGLLDEARGRKTFAAGLDEVWEAVREGRVSLVAVEEHYQQTVRLTEGHLAAVGAEAVAEPGSWDRGVREDIVDELVEAALDQGAEVVFLADEVLADHDRIAAVLRY
ncbi:chemotaxis protein [Kitasatospora sp. NPDC101801]|uniref:baeRF3 domain-containing protein n=1 Tax=Kitasatospora sp. NPDC101801 TaxID=3364103 RepID=UPI0037F36390